MDESKLQYIANIISKLHQKYEIRDVHFFGTGDKAMKKINSACSSYAELGNDEAPIICYDATFFGSATDGFLMTNKNIYIHNRTEDDNLKASYTMIKRVTYEDTDSDGLVIYLVLDSKRILIKTATTREEEIEWIVRLMNEAIENFR